MLSLIKTNQNWACWKDLLFTAVDECIPKCQCRKKPNAPWITKEIIVLSKKKTLYKKAYRINKTVIWEKYRQLNNSIQIPCNLARWTYIKKLAFDLQENDNPKPFWNFVKSKRRGTNDLVSLKVDDPVLTDDLSIARSMKSYFSSVFTNEDYENFPVFDRVVDRKLENIADCSVNEVKCIMQKLTPNKSPWPNRIVPCILKSCATQLVPSVTYMLKKSFITGQLPENWKHADITPLHKKGPKFLCENYRPISLTSIVCKIGEKIVFDRMIKFCREIDLIKNNQFGFLQARSTITFFLCMLQCGRVHKEWAG